MQRVNQNFLCSVNHEIHVMVKYVSPHSVYLPQMFLHCKFEDSQSLFELNVNIFSMFNISHGSKCIPAFSGSSPNQIFLCSRFVNSFPFGYLEIELNVKGEAKCKRWFFCYPTQPTSHADVHKWYCIRDSLLCKVELITTFKFLSLSGIFSGPFCPFRVILKIELKAGVVLHYYIIAHEQIQ